jgi:pimeloyl-ACP methyl ester carboxylesterase
MFDGLPKSRRGVLDRMGIAGREAMAFAKQAWLMRHDVIRPAMPDAVAPGDDVVVCLHGIFATAGVLRPMREKLERHDHLHTASLTYPAGPGVQTLARRLAELVGAFPRSTRLHLVGHSLGGVVARWFAQEIGDTRVVQTISLASPFAGIRATSWLGVQVAKDLTPHSPLLRKLNLGSHRKMALPHLSLIAENDVIVPAPLSHALPGGEVTLIRNCGHNTMLFHEEVAAQVERRVLAFTRQRAARPHPGA